MVDVINNLKFNIAPAGNTAQQLFNSGFIPGGEAKKNGWEEIDDIANTIKLAVTGLFKSVSALAGDAVQLGGGNEPIVVNTYRTLQSDVEITVNSLLAIDKTRAGKTGFFKNPEESSLAMQMVLEYQNVFEKTRVMTDGMMVELTDVVTRLANNHQSNLTNPNVITDVVDKTAA